MHGAYQASECVQPNKFHKFQLIYQSDIYLLKQKDVSKRRSSRKMIRNYVEIAKTCTSLFLIMIFTFWIRMNKIRVTKQLETFQKYIRFSEI